MTKWTETSPFHYTDEEGYEMYVVEQYDPEKEEHTGKFEVEILLRSGDRETLSEHPHNTHEAAVKELEEWIEGGNE